MADASRRPQPQAQVQPQHQAQRANVEARMNVAAVKRVDPYATDIVETSSHVTLYSFEDNEWTKTEIEGALFLYARRGPPDYSVLVMNRLSTENLIEPVAEGLELQLQEPFLLYRNSRSRIYGLWFYDKDECARVAAKIDQLVKESSGRPRDEGNSGPPEPPPPVDIFTMLSKAQDDYNNHRVGDGDRARPRPPPAVVPVAPAVPIASQSVMDFFAKAGGGAPPPSLARPPKKEADDPMTLQRLMSDPVHSVEHIEKQQRSATPKADRQNAARRPNGRPPSPADRQRKPVGRPPPTDEPPVPPAVPPETPQRPALMPPTMFTSSVTKSDEPTASRARPEPLTRNQLLQAFNYLVKHDAEFVTKLHEAYVKSFSELVS